MPWLLLCKSVNENYIYNIYNYKKNFSYNNAVIFNYCVHSDFKSLSKLSMLKHLDLGHNSFDKGILGSLSSLSALKSLKLDSNDMEGPLYDQGMSDENFC